MVTSSTKEFAGDTEKSNRHEIKQRGKSISMGKDLNVMRFGRNAENVWNCVRFYSPKSIWNGMKYISVECRLIRMPGCWKMHEKGRNFPFRIFVRFYFVKFFFFISIIKNIFTKTLTILVDFNEANESNYFFPLQTSWWFVLSVNWNLKKVIEDSPKNQWDVLALWVYILDTVRILSHIL